MEHHYYRVDKPHAPHSGLRVVQRERHRDWEIIVEHFSSGMTLRRHQFHVRIKDRAAAREEYLRGYASRASAVAAAQRRIDFIVDIRDAHPPRRQRAS